LLALGLKDGRFSPTNFTGKPGFRVKDLLFDLKVNHLYLIMVEIVRNSDGQKAHL